MKVLQVTHRYPPVALPEFGPDLAESVGGLFLVAAATDAERASGSGTESVSKTSSLSRREAGRPVR